MSMDRNELEYRIYCEHDGRFRFTDEELRRRFGCTRENPDGVLCDGRDRPTANADDMELLDSIEIEMVPETRPGREDDITVITEGYRITYTDHDDWTKGTWRIYLPEALQTLMDEYQGDE